MRDFLTNTDITQDQVSTKIAEYLKAEGHGEYEPGTLVSVMNDIFAGNTDFINFMMERRLAENFRMTARQYGSVLQNAKNIGYDIKRPVPAQGRIGFKINPSIIDVYGTTNGIRVWLPAGANLDIDGVRAVKHGSFQYDLDLNDIAALQAGKSVVLMYENTYHMYENSEDVVVRQLKFSNSGHTVDHFKVFQGEMREFIIDESSLNNQIGDAYQRYIIPDESFSDYYGNKNEELSIYTTVKIDSDEFEISRESFLNYAEGIESVAEDKKKVCIIESSPMGGVELYFGDGNVTQKGVTTTQQALTVRYLSTVGTAGNITGANGKVVVNMDPWTYNSTSIAGAVEMFCDGNITGGGDIEDIESIRHNSGAIFQSLGRVTTKQDYIAYLRSLSYPFTKIAMAWGEHDELKWHNRNSTQKRRAIKELANVILFTCIGDLYETGLNGLPYPVTSYDPIVADDLRRYESIEPGEAPSKFGQIFELFYRGMGDYKIDQTGGRGIAEVIDRQLDINDDPDIARLVDDLNSKSEFVVRNIYTPPKIIPFTIDVKVALNKMTDKEKIEANMIGSIYKWCRDNAGFSGNFYISKIIDVVESFMGVVSCDVNFVEDHSMVGYDISKFHPGTKDISGGHAPIRVYFSKFSDFWRPLIEAVFPKSIYGDDKITVGGEEKEVYGIVVDAFVKSWIGSYQPYMGGVQGSTRLVEYFKFDINSSAENPEIIGDIDEILDEAVVWARDYASTKLGSSSITDKPIFTDNEERFKAMIKMILDDSFDIHRYKDDFGNIIADKSHDIGGGMVILHPTVKLEFIYK
jgi:hypothetical protein